MADFYRGKRVSPYRKQHQVGNDTTLSTSSPILMQVQPGRPSDRLSLMKNFRGMVTIYPSDSTTYNNYSAGFIALLRRDAAEPPVFQDINMEASALLHPVPYAMGGAPLTLLYDFKGITLGQAENLWFIVKPTLSFGNNGCVWQMLWAQQDIVTPA